MKCTNCGTELPEGSVFCPECGTAAPAPAYSAETPADQSAETQEQQTFTQDQSYGQQQNYGQHQNYNQQTYSQDSNYNQQQGYSQQQNYNQQGYNQQQTYYNQQSYNYGYQQKPATPTQSIVGLVLGILSIVCCCGYGVGLLFGIPGVILSVMGNNKSKTGIGTAGMVCSIIGIVLSLIMLIYVIAVLGSLDWQDLYRELYYQNYYGTY